VLIPLALALLALAPRGDARLKLPLARPLHPAPAPMGFVNSCTGATMTNTVPWLGSMRTLTSTWRGLVFGTALPPPPTPVHGHKSLQIPTAQGRAHTHMKETCVDIRQPQACWCSVCVCPGYACAVCVLFVASVRGARKRS
jgi:hypothetical protein